MLRAGRCRPAGGAPCDALRTSQSPLGRCQSLQSDLWRAPGAPLAPDPGRHLIRGSALGALAFSTRPAPFTFAFSTRPAPLTGVEVAVRILLGWQEDEIAERSGKSPLSTTGWGQEFDILANGWESLPDQERADLQQIDRCVVPYDPLEFLWVDLYERWDPRLETRRGFAQRITDDFARQLEHYLDKSERRLEDLGFQKVPRKAARHHLIWLVQHRLCGLTCEEIADRHAQRNPQLESPPTGDAVSKAIRRTAAALQLA